MKTADYWNTVYTGICVNDPAVSGQLLPSPQNIEFIRQVQLDAIASHQASLKSLLDRWEAQSTELQFHSANCSVDPLLSKQKADCDSKDWMLRNCISELGKVVGDEN